MRYLFRSILATFSLFLLASSFQTLHATHYSGGEIYYRYVGDSAGYPAGTYKIFVNWYRNSGPGFTAGIGTGPQTVCITSSCGGNQTLSLPKIMAPASQASPFDNNGGWVVPDLDECADNSDASFVQLSIHKYSTTVTLSPCADYEFWANAPCCRDAPNNLVGASGRNMILRATLNNTIGESSSPEILAPAGKAFCLVQPGQAPFVFNQAARDIDNDSIQYDFATPQQSQGWNANCGPAVDIPWAGGFSRTNPIPSATGFIIDQNAGTFTFSPNVAGSYVFKIVVRNIRFDTAQLRWLNIGEMVREIQVPITSNCNPAAQDGPKIDVNAAGNNTTLQNMTPAEMDSIKSSYNVARILGADSFGNATARFTRLPIYEGYACFDTILTLEFDNNVRCESATPTDFRLIGPDGVPRPINRIRTNCQFNNTRKLDLVLFRPLDVDGNYLLQIRKGNDGNTLTNECGYEVPEFYSSLIEVTGCPQPDYQLDGLTVERDLDVRIDWSGNNDLIHPDVLRTFNFWQIRRKEADSPDPPQVRAQVPLGNRRFYVDSMEDNNGYYVDNIIYDYSVILVYNKAGREPTGTCSNMVVRVDSSQTNDDNFSIYWNDYYCIDEADRVYKIYTGSVDTSAGNVFWRKVATTPDSSYRLAKPEADSMTQGVYAVKVHARNPNGSARTDSSESNWIYYSIQYWPPPDIPEIGELVIPNIITPNGDGVNDVWYITPPTNGKLYDNISLTVYNRNGQKVFDDPQFHDNNDAVNGWDGTGPNGQKLANGVYFFMLRMSDPVVGVSENIEGTITIHGSL